MSKEYTVESALADILKKYGKGAIMKLIDKPDQEVQVVSTGVLSLDLALGVKGFPRGRIVEIYGPESSGKTTIALQAIANAQKDGSLCAFIDAEHALDPIYARNLGVQEELLLISQPDNGEQALEIVETLVRSEKMAVIVIDSVAALVPEAEVLGDMGDSQPGRQARLMAQALRKLTPLVGQSNTCIIFINQLREKIGVMFGSPETTTGGKSLKFYASVRLDIRRIGALKNGDEIYGNRTRVKVVKNKLAPPFREVEFDIDYGKGANRESDIIDLAIDEGFIEQRGAWLSQGELKWQGKENLKTFLLTNAEFYDTLVKQILEKHQ